MGKVEKLAAGRRWGIEAARLEYFRLKEISDFVVYMGYMLEYKKRKQAAEEEDTDSGKNNKKGKLESSSQHTFLRLY